MTTDEEKVAKACELLLKTIRDYVADPRQRAMLYSKAEEIQLIHKGMTTR